MTLARIITRFPEEAHELVESLRSRGFEVQTESPGKTSPQPADLEITIEECDAEEALQRATSVQDACAFVMPGAITGGVQPITAIPFIPQMNIEESETVGSEARAVSEQIDEMEDAGSHPLLSEEVHDPSFEESPGPGSPESVELAAESIAQVSIPSSGSELLSGEEVAAQQSMREKEPSSKSRPVSDWPIWQPISAEEKARETMGPAEQQQPIYDARTSAPFAPPLQRQAVPRSTMRRVRNSRLLRHPIFTNERMFWRTATFAGVIAIGLLLGMSAHRLSPLPASLQQGSGDLQPSETKPAAIVPAELKPVTRQSRAVSRATRLPKLPAETTPPAAASKVKLASSKQPVINTARDSTENDTDIAEDTVVRYGSRSGSSAMTPSQQKPAVKRNSDL